VSLLCFVDGFTSNWSSHRLICSEVSFFSSRPSSKRKESRAASVL
jgi:hypothetical protein